jgi:phosphoglycolate phosphatase-like HAD superfamily hydrolase
MKPDHDLPLSEFLTPDSILTFKKDHSDLFKEFSNLMPMGNFARDYYLIMEIIGGKSHAVQNQAQFDRLREETSSSILEAYQTLFYENRSYLQKNQTRKWVHLFRPFPGITNAICVLSNRAQLAIATNKDQQSVTLLLEDFDLTNCFLPENILDKDFAQSKRDHLFKFHKQHQVPFELIHFIDDKVSNLLAVHDLGINPYLALWGFNTSREQSIAREAGFGLLEIQDLVALVKG